MKSKLTNCKVCEKEIAKSAKKCPHCGAKVKKPFYKKCWFWVVVFFILVGMFGSNGDTNAASPAPVEIPSTSISVSAIEEQKEDIAQQIPASETKTEEPAETEATREKVSMEYLSALKKAELYSDMMHMSKAAIYDQLVSEYGEKFPADAAQYAIDNLDADYNRNALKKAETYSDTMYMSKDSIYDQLTSEYGEKFTKEEAQYAVDHLEADYKANALEKAKTYQELMSMSKSAIYDQLISSYGEKFTKEEAQFAIDHLE